MSKLKRGTHDYGVVVDTEIQRICHTFAIENETLTGQKSGTDIYQECGDVETDKLPEVGTEKEIREAAGDLLLEKFKKRFPKK